MLKKIILLLFCVLIGTAGSFCVLISKKNDQQQNIVFEVKSGSSLYMIAERLYQQGLIDSRLLFKLYVRLLNKTTALKAGEFSMVPQQSIRDIADTLIYGQSRQYGFAIIEGSTFEDIIKKIQANDNIKKTSVLNDMQSLAEALGADESNLEGMFLADTYYYAKDIDAIKILQRSYQAMQDFLAEAWRQRDPLHPIKTPYEALILASIVEKETAVASEREEIAGVFVNRLRKGMRLQTDPTVIYGLGDTYDGDITYKDLRTDTPYNTYTRHGLPPTPIAMPGKAAILAALNPKATDALFFVANGQGGHTFTTNLKDHEAAVRVYLKRTR